MLIALAGAIVLGVLSTFYDFVWAHFEVRHKAINGLVHGMTLLSVAGVVLAWPQRRLATGLAGGATAGLLAAASFYAFYPVLGYLWAIVAAWMLLWLLFGALEAWLRRAPIGERTGAGAGPDGGGLVRRERSTWYLACGPITARRRTTSGTSPRGRSRSSRGSRRCYGHRDAETLPQRHRAYFPESQDVHSLRQRSRLRSASGD